VCEDVPSRIENGVIRYTANGFHTNAITRVDSAKINKRMFSERAELKPTDAFQDHFLVICICSHTGSDVIEAATTRRRRRLLKWLILKERPRFPISGVTFLLAFTDSSKFAFAHSLMGSMVSIDIFLQT